MRTKVTLILILLNVVLLAVIFYARHEMQAEQDLARLGKRVLGNEAIGMNSLEITSAVNTGRIRLERASPTAPWEIKAPIHWPANEHAVRRIVQELEFLETQTRFPVASLQNGQTLADYGLNPPRLILDFTRPSTTPGAPDIATRLQIGDTTKAGNRLYILSPDGKTIHVVARGLANSLVVGMEELRTDALFTIPVFEVRSLGLQNTAPAPRVRLRRDGARWSFEAPIVTRASKADAEVVVSGLNRLRALAFLNEVTPADAGVDKPSLRVTLEGNNRRETLLLGKPYPVDPAFKTDPANPAALFYASMEGRSQVFVTSIPTSKDGLLDTLRSPQEFLRDKRILEFDPAAVTSISLAAPGQPEPLLLRRDESSVWSIVRTGGTTALPADAKLVNTLLQRLALLTAVPHVKDTSPFLRDAPSDAEVENYGFNLPQREITLTVSSPANGPVPPSPSRIVLQLGVSSANVQARVVGQSFIYAVDGDTLNDFPVAPSYYRERVLRTLLEGTRITGLSLKANDAPADQPALVSLSLPEGKSWDDTLADEPEARRNALKTVLAGLATLRAKQFVNDTYTETTLVDGKPAPWKYTLDATLALAGGSNAVTSLQIAERSGGGTQLAGSKEFGLVFALDQPLLDALWTLTYAARDPGPPASPAKPEAAP
ncbi:MAG: DUF4340 domain-containing protein [Rariglobus sp.]